MLSFCKFPNLHFRYDWIEGKEPIGNEHVSYVPSLATSIKNLCLIFPNILIVRFVNNPNSSTSSTSEDILWCVSGIEPGCHNAPVDTTKVRSTSLPCNMMLLLQLSQLTQWFFTICLCPVSLHSYCSTFSTDRQ